MSSSSSGGNDQVADTVKAVSKMNRWLLGLFIALLVFLVVEGTLIWTTLRQVEAVEGVLDYPTQRVGNRIEGVEDPAIRLSADGSPVSIDVEAEKCADTDKEVIVETRVSWDTINPRGTIIEDWNGVQEIQPGCNTYSYVNPMPDLVATRTLQLIADFPTLECVQWSIVGLDSPLTPTQAPERWLTEPFCIYPPE